MGRSMGHRNPYTRSQDGFSLATVLLIALAVILGSVAMIDRATSGWLGSLFVGQSREARDAAEIGLARVVSQLNRSRNRRLLVNAELLNSTVLNNAGGSGTSIEGNPRLISRCTTLTPDLSGNQAKEKQTDPNPLGEFGNGVMTAGERTIPTPSSTSGITKSYEVLSISQPPTSREYNPDYTANPAFNITIGHGAKPANPGEIEIRIKGNARRGNTLASTTITAILEVVPKCCGNSFNGANNAFGNDTRDCDWPPLGVISGTSKNVISPGGLEASGASVSFNATNESDPLSYVVCITTGCKSESTLNTNTGTTIKEEDTLEINDNEFTPKYTNIPGSFTCQNSSDTKCNINLSNLTSDGSQAYTAWDGITLTLKTGNDISTWPHEFKQVCTKVPEDGITTIHCNLNSLDFGANNRTVRIITSEADSPPVPLRLYFPHFLGGTTKTINQRNNGSFTHEMGNKGTITDLMMLGNFGTRDASGLLSCPEDSSQIVDLGNGTNQALRMFAYFRCGTVNVGGNGGYEGVLWANNIAANGNVTFNVPTNAVSNILRFINWETPMVDWVARSTKSIRLF